MSAAVDASHVAGVSAARRGWVALGIALVLVVGLAAAVRFRCARPGIAGDEVYHILTARSILATGEVEFAPGEPYHRAELFTRMVAGSIHLFGDTLQAARLPALCFSVAMVGALTVWVWFETDLLAGVLAGTLLAVAAPSVYFAQMVRFYSPQFFAVLLMLWMAAAVVRPGRSPAARVAAGLVGLAALAFGTHIQVTTVIPAAVAAGWVAAVLTVRAWRMDRRRVWLWGTRLAPAVAVLVVGGLAALWPLGVYDKVVRAARFAPSWAASDAHNPLFYWHEFIRWYQYLWLGLPLAAAVALLRRGSHRSVVVLWLAVIAAALLVHSFHPAKAMRYVHYVAPLMFAVWAVALATVAQVAWRQTRGLVQRRGWSAPARRAALAAVALALLLGLGYGLNRTYGFYLTRRMVADPAVGSPFSEPDWPAVLDHLRPQLDAADAVLVSSGMKGRYYLPDRAAIMVGNKERISRRSLEEDRDARSAAALYETIREHGRGVILIERHAWARPGFVEHDMTQVIKQLARPVEVPGETGLLVFAWGFEPPAPATP